VTAARCCDHLAVLVIHTVCYTYTILLYWRYFDHIINIPSSFTKRRSYRRKASGADKRRCQTERSADLSVSRNAVRTREKRTGEVFTLWKWRHALAAISPCILAAA